MYVCMHACIYRICEEDAQGSLPSSLNSISCLETKFNILLSLLPCSFGEQTPKQEPIDHTITRRTNTLQTPKLRTLADRLVSEQVASTSLQVQLSFSSTFFLGGDGRFALASYSPFSPLCLSMIVINTNRQQSATPRDWRLSGLRNSLLLSFETAAYKKKRWTATLRY